MSEPLAAMPAATSSGFRLTVDHIAIAVCDLAAAIEYFEKQLGFALHEIRETQGDATAMRSAVLKRQDVTFVLLDGAGHDSQVSRFVAKFGPGVHHVALHATGLRELASELEDRGLKFSTRIVASPSLTQTFTERDENSALMLELIERTGDADFEDQNVTDLFLDLERAQKI
jgi:methylmalonyl-CoA/ethylmalonyl-CoA epimerase